MNCTNLGHNIYSYYIDNSKEFICSKRCEMLLLPFTSTTDCFNIIDFPHDQQKLIPLDSNSAIPKFSQTLLNSLKSKSVSSSKSLYFDPFLDIKCSYKCPTEISDEFLGDPSSYSISHNNSQHMQY